MNPDHTFLENLCTIASEINNGDAIFVDLEFEGFNFMYVNNRIRITWCKVSEDLARSLDLFRGLRVDYKGKTVLSKIEDSVNCEVYVLGEEWEQYVNNIYQGIIASRVPPDDNLPF